MSDTYDLQYGPGRVHRIHHNGEARHTLELERERRTLEDRPAGPETNQPTNR